MSRCKKLFLLSIIGSAAIIMACGSGSYRDKIPTDLKITNGIAIAETEYPATIMLLRRYPQSSDQSEFLCSATFISDQDALTAAHCLEPYQGYAPTLVYVEFTTDPTTGNKIRRDKAIAVSARKHTRNNGYEQGPYDLAVVTFPAGTAPAIATISSAPFRSRETVTIVGFGISETHLVNGIQTGPGAMVKRKGTNIISNHRNGELVIQGTAVPQKNLAAGENSSSAPGDSGGSLYNSQGQLIGVVSGGEFEAGTGANPASGAAIATAGGAAQLGRGRGSRASSRIESLYVDLGSGASREFLARYLPE